MFRNWLNLSDIMGAPCETEPVRWNSSGCRVPAEQQRLIRKAYYACISYTDALVGRVLAALKASGREQDTVIALWGGALLCVHCFVSLPLLLALRLPVLIVLADHGWHLGDLGQWAKYTNFEAGTRIPLIVVDPRVAAAGPSDALVEAVDLMPTLAELAELRALPLCASATGSSCREGSSFAAVVRGQNASEFKNASFSQFPRPNRGFPSAFWANGSARGPFPESSKPKEVVMGQPLTAVQIPDAVPAAKSLCRW